MKLPNMIVSLCILAFSGAALSAAPDEKLPIKIYFLAGQSNMVGPGQSKYIEENHPKLMKPRGDVFCGYAGKVTGPLRPAYGGREYAFGPELLMGKVLGDEIENPILLIKSATGGTTLHKDWRPPSTVRQSGGKIGPLYTRMIRRFHNVLANIEMHMPQAASRGYEVAGFVWFQGENDSVARDANGVGYWSFYEKNLTNLIADVRDDLGVPKLPVLIIQINDGTWDRKDASGRIVGGPDVRGAQQRVADADPLAAWIKTADLHQGYHYDSASHVTIGERAGKALLPFARKIVPQKASEIAAGRRRVRARRARPNDLSTRHLAKGLIGYWKFDEGQGAMFADSSPSGHHGMLAGKRPQWVNGVMGKAVKLTGTQRIVMPTFREPLNADGKVENLSVSYWLCSNRYGDGRVGRGTGKAFENRNKYWQCSETANATGWDVTCHDNDFCGFATASFDNGPKAVLSDRPVHLIGDGVEWHHVLMVYNGRAKTFNIYVDGTLTDLKRSFIEGISEANHIIPAPQDVPLTLGGLIEMKGQFQAFDELAIWDRPLTLADAKALYNKGYGATIDHGR